MDYIISAQERFEKNSRAKRFGFQIGVFSRKVAKIEPSCDSNGIHELMPWIPVAHGREYIDIEVFAEFLGLLKDVELRPTELRMKAVGD